MAVGFKTDSPNCSEIKASPNFGRRVQDSSIEYLVLHYTGMPDSAAALDWMCNKISQVSCHYFIHEDGRIVQLVEERYRAWHAGKSYWKGCTDINSRSIGIEIANPGHEHGYKKFPDAQIESVTSLCVEICNRRGIKPENILAHSDIAPNRKQDPGEYFPWEFLAAAGVGLWKPSAPICEGGILKLGDRGTRVKELQEMLSQYGFNVTVDGEFGEQTRNCITAFQRRFRQQLIDGIADVSTCKSLQNTIELLEGRQSVPGEHSIRNGK